MDPRKPIGRHTVAELRDDIEGQSAIAEVTGLPLSGVAERVAAARHGAVQIRNLFRESWPWSAGALAIRTVAFAREHKLHDEIRQVTRATRILVSKRLNSAHGKQLLKNLFWDWWPDPDQSTSQSRADLPEPDDDDPTTPELQPNDAPVEIRPGVLLSGRYEIRERLGSGGFGTTWLAQDQLSGIELVLKIPNTDDGGAIRNELQRSFRVVHPNICQAFPDRDDDTGQPFLVMQYGGRDLAQRLQEAAQPFPLALAVHVLVSIADALDYLHQQLVLHLDVSPANILVDDDDVVRLTDFGASSRARTQLSASGQHTRVATSLHSLHPCYAAPELYNGAARSRSDQYSLFRVFCSLLEGRLHTTPHYDFRPFAGLSAAQNGIIARALAHDPDSRFESCAEPARALANELTHAPAAALAADVQRLAQLLVHRVELEERRLGSSTVRLGGALRLGQGLERLLQASLRWMGAADGFDPLAALREFDPHATTLDRATAGNVAKTVLGRAQSADRPSSAQYEIAVLARDLAEGKSSKIWSLINARNDVIHGRRPPEAVLPAASAVAQLLRRNDA